MHHYHLTRKVANSFFYTLCNERTTNTNRDYREREQVILYSLKRDLDNVGFYSDTFILFMRSGIRQESITRLIISDIFKLLSLLILY